MKKIAGILTAFMLVALTASVSHAQIIVKIRPERPRTVVVARPPAPSPRHVWVEEEWVPQGNTYVYHGGYWAEPARPNAVYVNGRWRHSRDGWVWRPGHWR